MYGNHIDYTFNPFRLILLYTVLPRTIKLAVVVVIIIITIVSYQVFQIIHLYIIH